jgi:hypothetical protein
MKNKLIFFAFLICSTTVLFSQNIGDSKFKIQMEETNKFLSEQESFLVMYDESFTYEVASEAHYIYYYFKDGICTGKVEKVVGTDLKSTYAFYNNILDNNDFGVQISQDEDYRCFIKNGVKTRVGVKKSYTSKNSWNVMIESGNSGTYPNRGC